VAQRSGEYVRRGIDVQLSSEHGEGEHHVPTLLLGLVGATVQGTPGEPLLTYTTAPLFWLRARAPIALRDLAGTLVAGYPAGSPVDLLTRWVLHCTGLGESVSTCHFAAGRAGDVARLRALSSAEVDVAVVGSGVSRGFADAFGSGSTEVLFFGDVVRVPSVGLALQTPTHDAAAPTLRAVVDAHEAALTQIRARRRLAVDACLQLIARGTRADAQLLVDDYAARWSPVDPRYSAATRRVFATWLSTRSESA
jgi:hypothetical protein